MRTALIVDQPGRSTIVRFFMADPDSKPADAKPVAVIKDPVTDDAVGATHCHLTDAKVRVELPNPLFTTNGVPGAQVRRNALVERLVPAIMLVILLADVLSLPAWVLMIATVTGAAAQCARVLLWRPWQTLRAPLVWILHAGYLWIPVHLTLRALSQIDLVPPPLATHALTVGAIGALTLGMMTRTARGHTGRRLVADRCEVVAFGLVIGAAIIRVFVPLLLSDAYGKAVIASAAMWSAAFAIYAVHYWPVLTRSRIDGAPG